MPHWKTLVSEDFTSGLGAVQADPGNGSISVSGGKLLLQTPGGFDCDWWLYVSPADSNDVAPVAYVELDPMLQEPARVIRCTCHFGTWTIVSGNTHTQQEMVLYYDKQNVFRMTRTWNTNDVYLRYIKDNVYENIGGPWDWVTWEAWHRFYINPTKYNLYLPEVDLVIPPHWLSYWTGEETRGEIQWYHRHWRDFSDFLGGSPAFEAATSKVLKFGVALKAWNDGSSPEVDSEFDNFEVAVTEGPQDYSRTRGQVPKNFIDEEEPGPGPIPAATKDAAQEISLGGPKDHLAGIGRGVRIPGRQTLIGDAPTISGTSLEPTDRKHDMVPAAAMDDELGMPRQSGGVPRHTEPLYGGNVLSTSGLVTDGHRDGDYRQPSPPSQAFRDGPDQLSDYLWRIEGTVQYHQTTLDPQAHAHFNGLVVRKLYYYRVLGEPWANPTAHNFTGFAQDGFHYTNGVQDVGPVEAPWRQEAVFPSGQRSNRGDFPDEVLIAVTDDEVVLFDIDSWPITSPVVWMRFEIAPSGSYYMMARNDGKIRDVAMKNGMLVACSIHTGSENGRLHICDFKQDGTRHCAQIIGSSNHWNWAAGYDIRNRNENGRWSNAGPDPELRIGPEYNYSVDVYDDHNNKAWIAIAGEDISPYIIGLERDPDDENIQPARWVAVVGGQDRGDDLSGTEAEINKRKVLFDENGWLWFSYKNKLFRNVYDYKGGSLIADQQNRRQRGTTLPVDITAIAQSGNFVYLGTARGVYKVDKMSLQAWLAFTIVGGGGGGFANAPPAGEILVGTNPAVNDIRAFTLATANILQVATLGENNRLGGVTTIRVTDDLVLEGRAYPDLPEDSVLTGETTLG